MSNVEINDFVTTDGATVYESVGNRLVDASKNAVMTQRWITLCIYLLFAFIKFQSKTSEKHAANI